MKNKLFFWTVQIIVVVLQWHFPIRMITDNNNVLKSRKEFRFKVNIRSPDGPFSTTMLKLDFPEYQVPVLASDNWQRQEQLYAIIQNDADGYAEITEVSRKRPTDIEDYIVSTGHFRWNEQTRKMNTTLLNVNFPFNYYFLENTPIERVKNFYEEYVKYSNKTIYAVVNVDKGKCAQMDLQVDGTSVKELVKSE